MNRGKIVRYNSATGIGELEDQTGVRLTFTKKDAIHYPFVPRPGNEIEFVVSQEGLITKITQWFPSKNIQVPAAPLEPSGGGNTAPLGGTKSGEIPPGTLGDAKAEPKTGGTQKNSPQAIEVTGKTTQPQPGISQSYPGRFLNPYNFVRLFQTERPINVVLGSAPPPPHDRYVGLSGRLTCNVTVKSPLFISDSQREPDPAHPGHFIYSFFQYGGKPALPASSLRGMLRSVYEAATNSCMAVFDAKRPPLGYRVTSLDYARVLKGYPGRILKVATNENKGEVILCYTVRAGAYYPQDQSERNVLADQERYDGNYVYADCAEVERNIWVAKNVKKAKSELPPQPPNDWARISGWLKCTGKNQDSTKRNEIIFLDPDHHGNQGKAYFTFEQQKKYNDVLDDQIKQGELPVSPASNQLRVGDLVWIDAQRNRANITVLEIHRVLMPRMRYRYKIGELLKAEYLRLCTTYEKLCPACRTFGWVKPESEKKDETLAEVKGAYAGRVRLSHGRLTQNKGRCGEWTLSSLSSPKPTTNEFYLDQTQKEDRVTYNDADARLRGRKFYRHHADWECLPEDGKQKLLKEILQFPEGERSDQNRTIRGAIKEGSVFEFDLDFENLAPLELGALLYSLELEEGMRHRLGYGRPLGLGSVEICVEKLEAVEDWQARLKSAAADAGLKTWEGQALRDLVNQNVAQFLKKMDEIYKADFELALKDLKAILSAPALPLPVHYPRVSRERKKDEYSFKWFMGNKRLRPPYILKYPAEDFCLPNPGLVRLDEKGVEQQD